MKDVDKMTDKERAKLFPIILEKHNQKWKTWYEEESQNILSNVGELVAIHHYGSTAIDNIMAKPTIDILIEIEKDTDLNCIKQGFIALGYNYMKFGEPPSMMFVKGYTPNGFAERVFHVHIYYKGLHKELLFRDYLINNPDSANEYEKIKIKLKSIYEHDRDGYTFAKSEFIKTTTDKALREHKNKAKA